MFTIAKIIRFVSMRKVRAPQGMMPDNVRGGFYNESRTDSATESIPPLLHSKHCLICRFGKGEMAV
ncbi:MAG: hypothetical protein Ta2B_25370 [Termitinemataceae bacterium]|nr:MAG: hypothetical protein Ta2B_25370 [Termitinemataceae bacterium]